MRWLWLLPLAVDPNDRLFQLVVEYSYLGVFLFLVACGLGFPSPEEVALIGGGFAVYKAGGGWGAALLMVAVAMAGVLVGDVLLWSIGRRVGSRPDKLPLIGRHLTPDRMERARALFAKHGAKAVFFGRFLFGIRAVTFFVSGSLRVPLSTFVIMDGLAALLSVPISVLLAWYFGAHLEEAFEWVARGNRVILLVVGIAAVVVGILIWRRGGPAAPSEGGAGAERDAAAGDGDAGPSDGERDDGDGQVGVAGRREAEEARSDAG